MNYAHQWKIEYRNSKGESKLTETIDFGYKIGSLKEALECTTEFVRNNFIAGHPFDCDHNKYI